MAQLAITGHSTRGKEVIEILEMLGGINKYPYYGGDYNGFYYIDDESMIQLNHRSLLNIFKVFTLEEFLRNYPYKVGDKVNYVKYNDEHPGAYTIQSMRWTGVTIEYLLDSSGFSALTKDLQPYEEKSIPPYMDYDVRTCKEKPYTLVNIDLTKESHVADKVEIILGDYEIKEEDGKTYLVKKKPQYPKTFEECCKVLGINSDNYLSIRNLYCDDGDENKTNYEQNLLDIFDSLWELRICRDAYWKIAGEQMGLGKSWEPDWTMSNDIKYVIEIYRNNV